jgi:glycosyltransferase involved in cell wall biosynthesis
MRLLVDLQALQNTSRDRGIGRYMRGFARGLVRNAGRHDVRFILSGLFPDSVSQVMATFADVAEPDRFFVFNAAGPCAALNDHNQWRSVASQRLYDKFVADLAPDVLLIGSLFEGGGDDTVVCVGPAERSYAVATILYDLIPLLNPDEHIGSAGARRWYFNKIAEVRGADLLLGISTSSCREALENIPDLTGEVLEIGAATDDEFASMGAGALRGTETAEAVLAFHGITRPFLMHASALDPRKNFEGLIDAFALLPEVIRRAHQLVLVCKLNPGGHARLLDQIKKNGLDEEDVVLTGFVPDDELRVLYGNCKLFIFPSFHEGFGLPVIEAMWCGAPAIGSCLSSVPEVIGLAEAQFDPRDMTQMVGIMKRALEDEAFYALLLEHAHDHARKFNWDNVAQRAVKAIERLPNLGLGHRAGAPYAIERVIDEIAGIGGWLGPTDTDLMVIASALDRNEQQSWPREVTSELLESALNPAICVLSGDAPSATMGGNPRPMKRLHEN